MAIILLFLLSICGVGGWDISKTSVPARAWETDGFARTFYKLTYDHHIQETARENLKTEPVCTVRICIDIYFLSKRFATVSCAVAMHVVASTNWHISVCCLCLQCVKRWSYLPPPSTSCI